MPPIDTQKLVLDIKFRQTLYLDKLDSECLRNFLVAAHHKVNVDIVEFN